MRDGLLLIDKDTGYTSHDAVQKVRRLVRQKKVGHCGTLDPNATGLLLLTLGKATRLTRFLIKAPKVYEGTIHFGRVTDTYDSTGETAAEHSTDGLTRERIAEAMARFEGTIEHAAPPYSAKKVGGKKLYELAREGEEVPRETKQVTVYGFTPLGELEQRDEPHPGPRIRFRLGCVSGTYARTLAHDLGQALGCGANLETLRRTKIGPFELADALPVADLEARVIEARRAASDDDDTLAPAASIDLAEPLGSAWVPFDRIPLPFPVVTTDHQQEERVKNGQTVLVRDLEGEEGDWIKLMNRRERLIAVGTVVERIGDRGVGIIQPRVVFK